MGAILAVVVALMPGAEAAPTFVLNTTAGTRREGSLESLGPNWAVKVKGEATAGDGWVSVRRAGQPLPPYPESTQIILTNGDRLAVSTEGLALAKERLALRHPRLNGGKPLTVPLTALAVIWLQAPDNGDDLARLRRQLATARRTNDRVLLRNGDVLEGLLEGIADSEIEIEVGKKPVRVPLNKVSAVALSSELARPLRPRGSHARLVLTDGSRLTLQEGASDGTELNGKTVLGEAIQIPLTEVAALEARHERVVYLSDLKPAKYEHTPYLGLKWPLAVDGSVTGGDLRLASGTHDRGLGMHSAARLTYTLPPGFEHFEALVGLDEPGGRLGSVKFSVEVDGKAQPIADGKELTRQSGAVPLRVAVKGAKELTLVVDFGRGGDVGDHVTWADARLVK